MEERKHHRPNWDDYFMAVVKLVATRSSCDRLYAGAVLVKNNRIIATGYNGSAAGLPTCMEAGHLMEDGHCVRTIHAEHNTVLQAARMSGPSAEGATLYTKYGPCIHCTKYVIAAGVSRVVIGKIYRNAKAVDFLRDAGIVVEEYKENPEWLAEVGAVFAEGIPVRTNEGDIKMTVE